MSSVSDNQLYTAEDVAQILRIKKHTVYEIIKRGELPFSKVGKQIRVSHADIEQYLQLHKKDAPSKHIDEEIPQQMANTPFPSSNSSEVIICGQDACLDMLLNCSIPHNTSVLRSHMGCYNSLYALYHGKVSMAATHLWDMETDSYNLPFIRRLLPGMPMAMLRLAGRMQGFYVKKGNPKKLQDWKDLVRKDIRMINREKGCGTRILLDQKLASLGIDTSQVNGYTRESTSHLACASTVAQGGADVACGCERGTYNMSEVDFIPLQQEWYDLVFYAKDRNKPVLREILDYASSTAFRQDLESMGGYDLSQTGIFLDI